jgi:hypothetical protein
MPIMEPAYDASARDLGPGDLRSRCVHPLNLGPFIAQEIEKAIANGIRFIAAPGQDHIHVAASIE